MSPQQRRLSEGYQTRTKPHCLLTQYADSTSLEVLSLNSSRRLRIRYTSALPHQSGIKSKKSSPVLCPSYLRNLTSSLMNSSAMSIWTLREASRLRNRTPTHTRRQSRRQLKRRPRLHGLLPCKPRFSPKSFLNSRELAARTTRRYSSV